MASVRDRAGTSERQHVAGVGRARDVRRSRALERVRARLLRRRSPRLQMALIVMVTGLTGFVSSFVLLRAGVVTMAVRYPVAAIVAYGVFLLQLRLWLALVRRRTDLTLDIDPFDLVDVELPDVPGIDLLDDAIVPLAIVLAGLFAAAYVVYSAPILFAELILDGIVVTSLYRRVRDVAPEGWLSVAVRRTRGPMLAFVIVLGVAGFAAARLVPGADSIGDVLRRQAVER